MKLWTSAGLSRPPTLTRRQAQAPAQADIAMDPDVRLQARWTGGSKLVTRLVTAGLWAALLTGPLALLLAVSVAASGIGRQAPAVAPVNEPAGERASVEEFAQRFVVTWLEAARGQERQLQPYVKVPSLALPEVGFSAVEPATADVQQLAAGVWWVTVGVTVIPPATVAAPATGNLDAVASQRRYFQVSVHYSAGAMVASALPAPTAAPAAAEAPQLPYRYSGSVNSPLAASVAGFLTSLLTGNGDVTRYISPGASIAPVLPAPYTEVVIGELITDRNLTGVTAAPAQGEQVRVLVTARATAGPKQDVTVQYALSLLARAGRWEVKAVDRSPVAADVTQPGPGRRPTN